MNIEDHDIALTCSILADVPEDVADKILSQSCILTYERGTTIFHQGQPATSIYIVLDGWIKLFRTLKNGEETVVGVFTRGDSVGEAVAIKRDNYPVAGEAVTKARLIQLPAAFIVKTMMNKPELMFSVLAATYQHLHELIYLVEQLKAKTVVQRVAEFLTDLCPVKEGAYSVVLPYEKVLIAGRLGIKPESLSRAFSRLKEKGVTIHNNHAEIKDVALLRNLIEQDRSTTFSRKRKPLPTGSIGISF